MPEVIDVYAAVEKMDKDALHAARARITSKAINVHGGNFRLLSDDELTELAAVNRVLRQKNAGPPSRVKAGPKEAASLDDLA